MCLSWNGHTTRTLYAHRAQDDNKHTHIHTHLLQGQEVLENVDSSSPALTHTHSATPTNISHLNTHILSNTTHKPHPHNISLHTQPPERSVLPNSTLFWQRTPILSICKVTIAKRKTDTTIKYKNIFQKWVPDTLTDNKKIKIIFLDQGNERQWVTACQHVNMHLQAAFIIYILHLPHLLFKFTPV